MTTTVRALRVHELGEPGAVLRLEEIPEPEPRPGGVRVAVAAGSGRAEPPPLSDEDGACSAAGAAR